MSSPSRRRWSRWIKAGIALGLVGAGVGAAYSLFRPSKHAPISFVQPVAPFRGKPVERPIFKENRKKSPEINRTPASTSKPKPPENYFSLKNKKNKEYLIRLYGLMSKGIEKNRLPDDWSRFSSVWEFPHSSGKWDQHAQALDMFELKLIDKSGNIDMNSPSTYFVFQPRNKPVYTDGKPLPLHEMGHFVDLQGRPDHLRIVHIYRPLWKP